MKKIFDRVLSLMFVFLLSIGLVGEGVWIEAAFIRDINAVENDLLMLGLDPSTIESRASVLDEDGKIQRKVKYKDNANIVIENQEIATIAHFNPIEISETTVSQF